MGNTDDLAMVQKMTIDTLHKEGKSGGGGGVAYYNNWGVAHTIIAY